MTEDNVPRYAFPKTFTRAMKEAVLKFRADVCLREAKVRKDWKIDPGESEDWFSLSLGFFVALGLKPMQCHRAAIWVRYETGYFSSETKVK